MKIIKAADRFHADMGEIKSDFLFTFGDYVDHSNMNLGHIRIFNDDKVWAGAGFPMHAHKYYEIVTIILDGWEITHEDSLGNKDTIWKNQIQVMNTSSGVEHSEMNHSDKQVSLYQLWLAPWKQAMEPSYYIKDFKAKDFKNNLVTLATGLEGEDWENTLLSPVRIHRGIFDAWESISMSYENHILVYVTSGKVSIWANVMDAKDQLRSSAGGTVNLDFTEASEVLIVEAL